MIEKGFLQHPVFEIIGRLADDQKLPCYVIGGFVRDKLLGRDFKKDVDLVVVGSGIAFANSVGAVLGVDVAVYKRFGTAMLVYDGLQIEFVGARKESYRSDSRNPIVEDGSLEDDQNRRDFTINAMAISLNRETYGQLVDPFGGIEDLDRKLIKTPLDPDATFSDDPLRMLRAIRFASQLGFKIAPDALDSMARNHERIKIISKERIIDELNKIILSDTPSYGFKLLMDSGLLAIIFPEMAQLAGVEIIQGKGHKDNFYHTLEVLDNVAQVSDSLWLRWAAIMHDIAKPATKKFDPKVGWTFHGHEDRGARMVPKLFAQLKLPLNEKMKFVQKLVLLHLRPIVLAQEIVTDSAVRRLLFEAGDDIDSLMILCHADVTTKNEFKKKKYRDNFELVRQKLKDVEERDKIRNWQPPVTGQDIMETFQLKPGKKIGMIKNAIREAILEGEIPNNKTEAQKFMLKMGHKMGLKPAQRHLIFETIKKELETQGFRIAMVDDSRPWGGYFVIDPAQSLLFATHYFGVDIASKLEQETHVSSKMLLIAPKCRLSWQFHERRREIWRIFKGKAGAVTSLTDEEGEMTILSQGDRLEIDAYQRHRLVGLEKWSVVAEIWQHTDPENPSSESDIVRVQDDFGR